MKITVAMRVIGGFTVISLLLFALGVSSIWNVSKIGQASEELSTVALPTVAGASDLKASFLNMGRLTFEGYVAKDKETVVAKQKAYLEAQEVFNSILSELGSVAAKQRALGEAVGKVRDIYDLYKENTAGLFSSHIESIEYTTSLQNMLEQLEEQTDDASSLLLDFNDLDEINSSANLQEVAKLTSPLEAGLMALLSVGTEYINTETLSRAELRSQEVRVILKQTKERIDNIILVANNEDSSGTIAEVADLFSQVEQLLVNDNGVIATKIKKLENQNQAAKLLEASDSKIDMAVSELSILNELADSKAYEVKRGVEDQISNSTIFVIAVIIISLGIAAFIAYVSVRAISRPLARINDFLNIASSGDLTRRLDDSSKDEFGVLSKNCNRLIDNLKNLIHTINQRADQLAAASGQTSQVTAQTTLSIEDQKQQISQIAAATTEMHTTSELVSANADDTLKQIKHADVEAEKVKAISAENRATIEVLANDVQQAAEVINKLHQDSTSIGGILDVIRGVADQTNLLALNAAIEAARAGEQGRGFAVVADEVRTLASRTQRSTQEINTMIEVLQAGAEKAVAVMNQGKEQTVVCVEQTEKAGEALNLITNAVHKAYEVSTSIEQAAREQFTVSSEISERLEKIVGIAEATTVGAQQTSDSSAEVAKLAEELQDSIRSFKV